METVGSKGFGGTAPRDNARRVIRLEETERRAPSADRLQAVADGRGICVYFQPIVDLRSGSILGFESLARFAEDLGAPDEVLAWADRIGLRAQLEIALIREALSRMSALPPTAYLSINVSPDVVGHPDFLPLFDDAPLERIVLELTEQLPVEDYPELAQTLATLRARGMRLAVDDAGAGFASLVHLLRLAPDVIKIDQALIRRLQADPRRRVLVAALVRFASSSQSQVVAEGIETQDEAMTLRKLGVRFGQGFFLARPTPEPRPNACRSVRARKPHPHVAPPRRAARLRTHVVTRLVAASLSLWLVGGASIVAVSSNADPGSPLWPVRLQVEQVRVLVEPNPTREAELHLAYAGERLQDLTALTATAPVEEAPPTLVTAVESNLERNIAAALEKLPTAPTKRAVTLQARACAIAARAGAKGAAANRCGGEGRRTPPAARTDRADKAEDRRVERPAKSAPRTAEPTPAPARNTTTERPTTSDRGRR